MFETDEMTINLIVSHYSSELVRGLLCNAERFRKNDRPEMDGPSFGLEDRPELQVSSETFQAELLLEQYGRTIVLIVCFTTSNKVSLLVTTSNKVLLLGCFRYSSANAGLPLLNVYKYYDLYA